MPDQLELLFAELRAEEIVRVCPPGAAAARRTVRRRRIAKRTALVAAVGLIAGGSYALRPAVQQVATPAPDAADQRAAVEQALGRGPGFSQLFSSDNRSTVMAGQPAGRYHMDLACADDGQLSVRVKVGSQDAGGAVVGCSAEPKVVSIPLDVAKPEDISFSVEGDGGPVYGVRMVPVVEDPVDATPSEESTFNSSRAADLIRGTGILTGLQGTTEKDQVHDLGTLGPGNYYLAFACAGPGTVFYTFSVGTQVGGTPHADANSLECTDAGSIETGMMTAIDTRSRVTLSTSTDVFGVNHAGYAWALTKG